MDDNIINLEIPQKLQDLKIVTEFFFESNTTNNFVLELNHAYNNIRIISHYSKDWNRCKRNFKDALKEKEVQDQHSKLILETLDVNYNTITITQENYDKQDDNNYEEDQAHTQKKDSTAISKDDDGKKTYTINKYSQGIPLAESVLIENIPFFMQIIGEDKKTVLSKKLPLSDIDLVPPERTEYLSKEYNFSSVEEIEYFIKVAKNECLDSIFQRVKLIWTKYIDVDEDFITICVADTIFSYFQDKLGMTHYLWIVGNNNTGKSNILLLFSLLGYRAVYDTAITPANIYNFGSQLEEGQCIIIEDELDDIDFQDDKKKLYKVSYRSGTKVTRMYENNSSSIINSSNKRKVSSKQQGYFLYCFKVFAAEKMPDKIKSKGFVERIIPLKSVSGDPPFDISEVVNDAGDEQFKELYNELMNIRKLLLMYRLLHNDYTIPNVKLNIKNRYKQLTKPLIRLFQNTKSLELIITSLSKYVIEKNQEKIDSLDSAMLFLVIDLVNQYGSTIYNDQIWEKVNEKIPGAEIAGKPYSYFSQEYGTISKTKITNICENKLQGKQYKDKENGRGFIFNQKTLNKLSTNYSIIEGIKIIKQAEEDSISKKNSGDTYGTYDTSTENTDSNSDNNSTKDNSKIQDSTNNDEEKTQNENLGLKILKL